jgi:hypothetical protein
MTSGARAGNGAVRLTYAGPPAAPALSTPINGAYTDLAATPTFTWAADPNGAQTAFAFRRKLSPSGSYEWWNASTVAWQGTEVFNASAALSLTFPAAKWVNGSTYNWSVATQNTVGVGPYVSDLTVIAESVPTVTLTAPAAVTVSSSFLVSWTLGPSGEVQSTQSVLIYTAAQAAAVGFTPGVGPFYSGYIDYPSPATAGSFNSIPAGSYLAAVQVTSAGGQRSAWATRSFTVMFDAPAPTVITAFYDPTGGRTQLLIAGHDNLLDEQTADPEATLGSWAATGGGTIALNSDVAMDGLNSLGFTGNGGASPNISTGPVAVFEAVDGQELFLQGHVRPKTVARSAFLTASFYDNGFRFISQQTSPVVAEVAGAWTPIGLLIPSVPAGTGIIHLSLSYTAVIPAAEVHYSAEFGISPNESSGPWSRGGLAGLGSVAVTYTDADGETGTLRNGAVALHSVGQMVTVNDYDAKPGVARTYTPTLTVTPSGEATLTAIGTAATVTPAPLGPWLKDPLDPASNVPVDGMDEIPQPRARGQGVFIVLGRPDAIVVSDVVQLRTGQHTCWCFTTASFQALDELLTSGRVLLLQRPVLGAPVAGESLYILPTGPVTATVEGVQDGDLVRTVVFTWIEQLPPVGPAVGDYLPPPLFPAGNLYPGPALFTAGI